MTEQTKLALINFTGLVATAIARQANDKFVNWREVIDAQETLEAALQNEPAAPGQKTQTPEVAGLTT